MSQDIRKTLKSYMISFPGSASGFMETISDIFITLGKEWDEHGKKEWAKTFIESGEQLLAIAKNLNRIKDEFDLEQMKQEVASVADTDVVSIIKNHVEKLKEQVKSATKK